ncbi:unnamed protein product [Rhizoctonia solani]|uniref:Nephrocystin 3-like N-terminal domain-containing protein n=1 Tax=Rhizoctonia solani TaxID=456999 RepID=A0A8H3GDL2_9AGAM|nr:unnamed protein product [Rhizoctonia solani]
MPFRDSLAQLTGELKKGPHIDSGSTTPTPPSVDLPEASSGAYSDSTQTPIPTTNDLDHPVPADNNNEPAVSTTPEINDPSGMASTAWSGARTLLAVLESSADSFGPLKSAVGGLDKCIDSYERATKGRKDNEELLNKLKELVDYLGGCMADPVGLEMTNSVKQMCTDLEADVKRVEKKLERATIQQLVEAMDASDEISECYRRIQNHLQRLTLNATMNVLERFNKQEMESRLTRISPAMSALYNSAASDDVSRGGCTPGTRQAQIDWLLKWARDPAAEKTCWMNGMAGAGKTTIAYSVCNQLDGSFGLGASFFCSRVISECRQVKHIIPSIAYQLARFSFPFRCALDKVLESDPDAHTRAPKLQYERLVAGPLSAVQASLPSDLIVVIDALDECENENSLRRILDLLLSTESDLPIRFLVSSRPEPEIHRWMMDREGEQGGARLVLQELNKAYVRLDIETYVRRELQHIPLTDVQRSSLIDRRGALFISASTMCRYVDGGHKAGNLENAVNTMLRSASVPMEDGDENTIDELYSIILEAAFHNSRRRLEDEIRMKDALETVICAQAPMSLVTLASFLGLQDVKQVEALLQPLRSVLHLAAASGFVTALHPSFPDFMLSSNRSKTFHCVAASRNVTLAGRCLQLIDTFEPKFNVCRLPSSYLSDNEVVDIDKRVGEEITPTLIYACRYWSTHLYLGELQQGLVPIVHKFFLESLLVWMEILNLTKHIRFGPVIIRDAEKWCQNSVVPEDLIKLACDARQFVSVYANHPISQSTPHIYVSMLAFWPRLRPVSVTYIPRTTGILEPMGTSISQRQPVLLATWRVCSSGVHSISLSSDGSKIAATNLKGTIDLVDALTGDGLIHIQGPQTEKVQAVAISPDGTQIAFGGQSGGYLLDVRTETIKEVMKPNSTVQSIVFSPDGSQFAFGLSDGNIHIYPSQKGSLVLDPLKGHTGTVWSIAFSPNGLFLASGSYDTTICVWDAKSGQMIGTPLQGHTALVCSVSYSPDCTQLASASWDSTIRVWDPLTGQIVLGPLIGNSSGLNYITFSPDGAFIASASNDQTIQVYDAQTGQTVCGPLEGHTSDVNTVIFSPDSTQLFSCSYDGTICLWDVQDLDVPNSSQPTSPDHFLSVQYSPDGLQVASGSFHGNVCVWDVQTGEMVLGPLQGHSSTVLAVDFSPNNMHIASASVDSTLRIWSAQDGSDLHGPIQGHAQYGSVNCVRFSPAGSMLVSGGDDGTVQLWDVASGQSVNEPLKGHTDPVYSVSFSPDGSLVASGSYDGIIRVWDINTGQTVVGILQDYETRVHSVQFSPDGLQILCDSCERSIQTWDAQTGQSLLVWGKHQYAINSVSYSPNGLLVVSGSDDNTTRIWDAQTGELKINLEGHSSSVQSAQFSPDGLHVVSCSYDGTIRFWDVSSRIANVELNRSKGEGI